MSRIRITAANADGYFYLEPLSAQTRPPVFRCAVDEYNGYLCDDAIRVKNAELYNKNRKTISMRKDIYS